MYCVADVECAVKVLEKRHIVRENKTQYVKREKEVLMRIDHPFFVKLHFTFQDDDRLCIFCWCKNEIMSNNVYVNLFVTKSYT